MRPSRVCLPLAVMAMVARAGGPAAAQEVTPPKDARVWVVDDTEKVNPVTSALLREGMDVYSGRAPGKGDYRRVNSVWDAATNTVKLFAGRNEFVSFQVVFEKQKDDLHKVFVTATDLIGARERIGADRNIRMFKQLYLSLRGNWFPDALLPFELGGATPLEIPDVSAPPGNLQKAQSVWVDIYVPHDLAPDKYTGQIMIVHRNAIKQAILRVELEVGDFTLSDELHLSVDLMNYGFLNIERGWPDLLIDSPRHRRIEREFFRSAHEHRMAFAIVPYNHDGSIPKGSKPELKGVGDGIGVADWSAWDDRFGPLLSGEAFADLPRGRQPVDHFFLPYNLMWPSDMRNWQKPEYRIENVRIGAEFGKHLAEKGWTRTQYQIYYNHKESYGFFPWNLDEPTRDEDLAALRYLGQILKEAFPNDGAVKVLDRLDVGHFHCENVPSCTHKRPTAGRVISELGPFVGLWNIGSPHYWANLPEVRKLKQAGKTLYFYNGTPPVTEPLVRAVFWGWNSYKYEADGVCFWNATDWTDWDTDAPAKDPYTNAGGRYAGFSMVFYPGSKFGYDGPIPSMRLKAMRRGFQDFEYLRTIEQRGIKTRQELVQLAGGLESDYPKLRRIVFDLLRTPRR